MACLTSEHINVLPVSKESILTLKMENAVIAMGNCPLLKVLQSAEFVWMKPILSIIKVLKNVKNVNQGKK
jgi:hypothetical protein